VLRLRKAAPISNDKKRKDLAPISNNRERKTSSPGRGAAGKRTAWVERWARHILPREACVRLRLCGTKYPKFYVHLIVDVRMIKGCQCISKHTDTFYASQF
jgi:hypothetical protein